MDKTPQEAVAAFIAKRDALDALRAPQLPNETALEYRQRVIGGAITALQLEHNELSTTLEREFLDGKDI